MKVSGYGRISEVPAENAELTHVTAGTPMGEVLRRYWGQSDGRRGHGAQPGFQ